MSYDVIVIGGGLSGLTAVSLLAKPGLTIAGFDKNNKPVCTCDIFTIEEVIQYHIEVLP